MSRLERMAECHPERKHKARGLCATCYASVMRVPTGRTKRAGAPWNQTPERREAARQLGLARRVHGHAGGVGSRGQSPTYQSWRAMKARCLQPRNRDYPRYGGRGITVDQRWLGKGGFVNFLSDMGPRPDGLTLDRIDNDGGYGPSNCRWTTPAEQRRNRPQTRGWKQRADRKHGVYGTKTIVCLRCGTEGTVKSMVARWYCPGCKPIVAREATARYRAKHHG